MTEPRGLARSIQLALVLTVAAVVLGIVFGARVLVFEGAFGVIGIVMSWLAIRASRAVDAGPTPQYPFGRAALTPLVVVLQGLALAATLVYAAADAVIVILAGGQRVDALVVVGYMAVSAAASVFFASWLRRAAQGSDLLLAEAAQWRAGGVRGLVTAIGALVALALAAFVSGTVLDYVDPVLVLVSCALVAPIPVRLLRHGLGELLEASPDGAVLQEIERVIDRVSGVFDLPSPVVRSTKLGSKLYIDVVWVIDRVDVTIAREDEVRRATISALRELPFEVWAMVELTTDPALAD